MQATKIVRFDAAHFLPSHTKCGRMHGHTYTVEVTVTGPLNDRGMVIDFHTLGKIIQEEIIDKCDHQVLNEVLPIIPTAKNLAVYFVQRLRERIESPHFVSSVRVWETPDSYATWGFYHGE